MRMIMVMIAESKQLIEKLNRWRNGMQSKGTKVNMNKTKVASVYQ